MNITEAVESLRKFLSRRKKPTGLTYLRMWIRPTELLWVVVLHLTRSVFVQTLFELLRTALNLLPHLYTDDTVCAARSDGLLQLLDRDENRVPFIRNPVGVG